MNTRVRILLAASVCLAAAAVDLPSLPYKVDPNWPKLPAGWNLQETPGVAVDANDHVYVFHRGEHPIIEFDANGEKIRSWGEGMFIRPHAVRVDREGAIWVVDNDTHQVLKMDSSGRVRMVMGRKGQSGETDENFNRPTDVAFAANGDFYVTDGYGNSRVVKFSSDGTFLKAWGKRGTAPGDFNLPHTIVVDSQGRVLVGDRENFRLQIFDSEGKVLDVWTHVGSPWGLAITANDELFLADGHNNRILELDMKGNIVGSLGSKGKLAGQLDFVHHLAVDSNRNLYAAEIKNWRVQKFVPR